MDHLTESDRMGYRQRTLGPQALLTIDRHIAECALCRELLMRSSRAGAEAVLSQLGDGHLRYEELEALAKANSPREAGGRVEAHINLCTQCRAELDDLRVFIKESNAWRTGKPKAASWWTWPRLASQAAVIVVAFGLGSYWWKSTLPAAPVLTLNDAGGEIVLRRDGELTSRVRFSAEDLASMGAALTRGEVTVAPSNAALKGGAPVVRSSGVGEGFALQSPVGVVVVSERPVFAWEPLAGASAYRVAVYAPGFRKVAESDWIKPNTWKCGLPLETGETFSWQVTARRGTHEIRAPGLEDPEARFAVATAGDRAAIEAAKRDHPDAHLLLALRYAKAGAVDQAEEEFRKVVAANPQAAGPLLEAIRSLRK